MQESADKKKKRARPHRQPLKQYGVRVNGVLIRKSFRTAAEARRWQRDQKDVQDKIRSGNKPELVPTLLSVHAVDFLNARKQQASYGSQEAFMGKYVLARKEFKDKYLHEITKGMWKPLFGENGELRKKYELAPATHNRIRSMLHKMYEDARREFDPPRAVDNPIHNIAPLEEPKKKIQILATQADIAKYLEAAKAERLASWWIYTAIKLNTGLRQQNITPLRWRHWKGDHFEIQEKYVRGKHVKGFKPGSKSDADERVTPVNDALRAALETWRKASRFNRDEDFIVCTQRGKNLSQTALWEAHKRTILAAGLPYMSEHKLRHTYASHYLAAGGNIHDLKQNLFHSSVTTTEIYSHALKSEMTRRGAVFQVPMTAPKQRGEVE